MGIDESSNGSAIKETARIDIEKPLKGWKSWFDEKLDQAEIAKMLMKESKEKTQEELDKYLKKITSIKMRIVQATTSKAECETRIVAVEAAQSTPEANTLQKRITEAKDEIKLSKKHLDVALEKMASVVGKLFDFPSFNKLEICNNRAISISVRKELDWDLDDEYTIPKECFERRAVEIKKAIAPWVKDQINMGRIDIEGIRVKPRLKVSATLKKNRAS